jgi:CheY-like chemotaxis protein
MPRLSGLEVIQKIRAKIFNTNKKSKNMKILEPSYVIVSAYIIPTFRKHLSEQMIDFVFEKPLQTADLRAILAPVMMAQ